MWFVLTMLAVIKQVTITKDYSWRNFAMTYKEQFSLHNS